jgi:hypothetical protein
MMPGPLIDSRRFEDTVVQWLDSDSCSFALCASERVQAGRWPAGCSTKSTALRGRGRR